MQEIEDNAAEKKKEIDRELDDAKKQSDLTKLEMKKKEEQKKEEAKNEERTAKAETDMVDE